VVVLLASLLAMPAVAETQLEPVARLSVEGGYDSNVLYDGRSDRFDVVLPELGLKARAHLWDLTGIYSAAFLQYQELRPQGVWNHRGVLQFSAEPTERVRATGGMRAIFATDPVGLAQAGIFRTGEERAFLLQGTARMEYAADHRMLLAGALTERYIRFDDRTGGAMHGPSVEALRALNERLLVGGAFAFTMFDDFQVAGTQLAYASAVRGRLRYKVTRFLEANAFAGPAYWTGPGGKAIVPEAGAELLLTERDWDLRVTAAHALGLGSTSAAPALVNSAELGTVKRFGRKFDLRVDGGIWQSGDVPTMDHATIGYAVSGDVGWYITRELRLALTGSHLARLDNSSPELRRTTVGIRMGWELPVR
jgi:hypothetical protein